MSVRTDRRTDVIEGVTYVFWTDDPKDRYAACCGNYTCTSECKAVIHHGPGHQSRTHCRVKGPHEVHEAVYGSHRQFATWRTPAVPAQSTVGPMDVFSGFFDEPPEYDEAVE